MPGLAGEHSLRHVKQGRFWDLIVRTDDGQVIEISLDEHQVSQIEVVASNSTPTFDGDARNFRLGVEALRIQNAFQHDMAGLAVSRISPLPHQLEAVYGSFLTEPRLRFLLADDPGAGKTIMAGLYIKELQLRRAADRILIVAPAMLRPQWFRELSERFGIDCVQFDRASFAAHPTQNPWDVHDLVIVSRDFMARPDVIEAFAAADKEWDLAIIDEAHGFTLQVDGKGIINKKTVRYKAAERIAAKAHRLVLLTATPHSGRTESLWGLLRLLDPDAYGDRCPKRNQLELNPNQYRKVSKERMVDMTGTKLFKPRHPRTVRFNLTGAELTLYDAVTNFVSNELAAIRGGGQAGNAAGFALTTMQRRLASSIRAIRRTIERRIERLEKALEDPVAYLQRRRSVRDQLVAAGLGDSDELAETDRWALENQVIELWLPDTVDELTKELAALRPLLVQAQDTEQAGGELKFAKLLEIIDQLGLREDKNLKLLVFTEHKDTLNYLVDKLSPEFELAVIHGDMDLRGRIDAEKRFREDAQIMVATEAAGEGINLQFCHLMVNYDIPWNPNRLEQRMGRIHRIGQEFDVHIFNLVAANTREGFVLAAILHKIELMGTELGDRVFDVIGEILADYRLSEMLERVLAGEITREQAVEEVGGDSIDPAIRAKFDALMEDALAADHLDWQAEAERAARAEERRLPPGYLRRFFEDAVSSLGGTVEDRLDPGTLRVVRTPDHLVARSREAGQTRLVHPKYERLTFDRAVALRPRTSHEERSLPEPELCGPGHPLFDAIVADLIERCRPDVIAGAVFTSPDVDHPTVLTFLTADSIDGNNDVVHRAFATVEQPRGGVVASSGVLLYDLLPASGGDPGDPKTAAREEVVNWARSHEFERHYEQALADRERVADIQEDYLKRSFAAILARHDSALLELDAAADGGSPGAEGRVRQAELAKAQVTDRRDRRLAEVERSRSIRRGPVQVKAVALVLPGGNDEGEDAAPDRRHANSEIERIAVAEATRYEHEVRVVDFLKSVERDNIGFDLLSLKGIDRRCIEVKGRAGVGMVELTWSEFMKAIELGDDYWLYVVLDCATASPRLYRVRNPARTLASSWAPSLDIRYRVEPQPVIDAAENPP